MNRWLNDPRLRRLANVQFVLLVVAIALAAYAYTSAGPRRDAGEDRESFDKRLATARGDLAELRSGARSASLREELQNLEATTPPAFPPLASALEFGTAVTEYAASQQLALDTFDVASGSYDAGGTPHPAISYSIRAHGPIETLAGVLSVPTRFPTSVTQNLELTRPDEPGSEWSLLLTLVVVHSGE
ncbi:MAG: hypothetical protein HYY34_06670 [Chloroflexi bacterium]|nr:hypothetical protein [Chloroflexota bacterium]